MVLFRYAVMALAGLAAAASAGAQALYSPPEGDFQIAFPETPQVASRPANRSKDVALRRYVAQEPSRAMIVSIEDFPQGDLPPSADAGIYDRVLRMLAEEHMGRLVSTRAARLAGRPCLEGQITGDGGETEIVRVLMLGDRMYQVTYALPEGAEAQGADAAFFASFRITKAP